MDDKDFIDRMKGEDFALGLRIVAHRQQAEEHLRKAEALEPARKALRTLIKHFRPADEWQGRITIAGDTPPPPGATATEGDAHA